MRAGELTLITEKMGEQQAGLDFMLLWDSIDSDFSETFHKGLSRFVCHMSGG